MSSNRLGISRLGMVALPLALGLTALASYGQTAQLSVPRVHSAVDSSPMVALQGNTHPLAQPRFDRGVVPDSTPTGRMILMLKRSDAQQAALDHALAAQQDPKSPSYHKWLTPASYGAQFGVADADVQAVTAYLSSQGFAVGRVFANKMAVEFSGTAGQVRSTFQTEVHTYAVQGQTFHANASDPRIPAALAPVVKGIGALDNYKAPRHSSAQQLLLGNRSGQVKPLYDDPNVQRQAVSPGDLAVIYDIPTTIFNGQGVTVGVVNDSNINLAIPANYRTTFGLPAVVPTVIADGTDPGINSDDILGYEQIELISAVAPNANINYYVSGTTDFDTGLHFAALRAVEDNVVQVLVFPFESCERTLGQLNNYIFSLLWEQAAAQGMSVVVGTGNGGAEECDAGPNSGPNRQATQGLAVNGFASTPYNTAVGASDFYFAGGFANYFTYWSLLNLPGGNGYASALRYIPEQPANSSYQATNIAPQASELFATGGGRSTVGLSTLNPDFTFTSSPYPQPSYQTGVVPASVSTPAAPGSIAARVIPDVSMYGGAANNRSAYIFCVQATDCVNATPSTLQYTADGNSSAAAAVFGGVAALLVQAKGPQGNLNPTLYATYTKTPAAFHDITVGTNAVSCQGGTADCGANGFTTSGGGFGFPATAGYDAASGLGSVDVAQLISAWSAPNATANVTLSLTLPNTTTPVGPFRHGDQVQLNVSVTGSSGTPTGDVAILASTPQPASDAPLVLTLSNGQAVDTYLTLLPGGSYNLTARYAGDKTFGPATASIPVTVTPASSRIDLASSNFTSPATVTYGSSVQFTLTIANPNNPNDLGTPTGSITVTDNGRFATTMPLSSIGSVTFQSSILDAGVHTFTASYSGDNSYGASTLAAPLTVTITGAVPTSTTLTTSTGSLSSRNGTVELVSQVIGTGNGAAPKGSVQFFQDGKLASTVNLDLGSNVGTNRVSTAVLRINANGQPVTSTTFSATYVPDATGDYAASSSAPVTVGVGAARGLKTSTTTITTTPLTAANFVNTGTVNLTATVTAAGNNIFTGTVTFFSNGTLLGSPVNVDSQTGTAAFNITPDPATGVLPLPLGQSYIVAAYSGDANNAASSGAYTVNTYGRGSTPDFTMQTGQAFGILSPTVASTNFRLQFAALDGFSTAKTPIALTISGPASIACTANPLSVVFNGVTYTNATITCGAAPGFTVASLAPHNPNMLWMAESGAALACIFLFGMPARRRSWQSMIGALALVVVAFGATGCGVSPSAFLQRSNTAAAQSSTPTGTANAGGVLTPGTYTVVVTGTANVFAVSQNTTVAVVHTLPLNVVVQ